MKAQNSNKTKRRWNSFKVNALKSNYRFLFEISNDIYGVYKVCSDHEIHRLKGQSEILYIGKGKLKHRLIALLDPHFKETGRKHTAKKDLKRLVFEEKMEVIVYYKICQSEGDARTAEGKLITEYCKKHIEPPPLNHTRK